MITFRSLQADADAPSPAKIPTSLWVILAAGGLGFWALTRESGSLGGLSSIRVVVKGPKKTATRAATRRGIPVRNCSSQKNGTYCDVPCRHDVAVAHWYSEAGRSPGTLLFYSPNCGSSVDPGRSRARMKS